MICNVLIDLPAGLSNGPWRYIPSTFFYLPPSTSTCPCTFAHNPGLAECVILRAPESFESRLRLEIDS